MSTTPKYKIGGFTFTPERNELAGFGQTHRLEDRASRVLEHLCQNAGEVISKEALIENVWEGRHLSEQSVPVVISNLRKTFSEGGATGEVIETIPKRGYRIVEAKAIFGEKARPIQRWFGVAAAIVTAVALGIFFLQGGESEARKPGIILTLNDIQNGTGDETKMAQVIAMSEAGSHFLSQAQGILLIRHWWNIEADDPTGGIFERYGDDAPIYHVSGTLFQEGDQLQVTLFLNNPKTDEVLWSEAFDVSESKFTSALTDNLGRILAVLGLEENLNPPGDQSVSEVAAGYYWLGLYFWHLGTEDTAKLAHDFWQRALDETPEFDAARIGQSALIARWPDLFSASGSPAFPEAIDQDSALLVQAGAIALYQDQDVDRASDFARRAIALSPNDHAAYGLLAETLVMKGQIKEALLAIKEAQILAPFQTVYPERAADFQKQLDQGD